MRSTVILLISLLAFNAPLSVDAQGGFPWDFIEDVFQFLCNRCKDIINTVDNILENEPFKRELDGLCRTFIPEPTIQGICVNVIDAIVGGIYDQLQRLQPNPQVCTTLRLCLECGVPSDAFYVPTSPPVNLVYPTLPADLFPPHLREPLLHSSKDEPFRSRRSVVIGGVREESPSVAVRGGGSGLVESKNASLPFDAVIFYTKVAELAHAMSRLKRMAEEV